MRSTRRPPTPRTIATKAISALIAVVLLLLMINDVFPWAAASLADGFTTVIERAR